MLLSVRQPGRHSVGCRMHMVVLSIEAHLRRRHWDLRRRDMPAMLSYEDFVAAALDTQRQLSAQSLAEVFSALDQASLDEPLETSPA